MGGRGSGRQAAYCGKDVTQESTPLDVRKLARSGLLVPGRSFSWQWTVGDRQVAGITIRVAAQAVQFCYQKRSTGESIDQWVHLQSTPCQLGGARQWFTCPSCGKRVAVLYGPGKYFACRRCCGLGYASQKEGLGDRSSRQADKIRNRLGWQAGILNGEGGRPKGMHWATYRRLKAEYDRLVQISFHDIGLKLGFLDKLLDR
ncbi:hypothetical protein [Candidatus Aalborgicola defluviihabitans]|uniref:hypothetical protein n=1 Tax=Candidatus Aalborgicola defluviihabitans TaxID=3386187 RepID=UPI001D9BCEAF|nr:hypothetical protein [Burkholderiales bacterium]MBK6567703.1 hypothetical protein [Burkholderiales bacterium]MBK7313093.1 hypothetical protein [Burkholderiales bacterium]MBL0245794.1 hypothetical protein [Rhodoferax sp.]